MFRLVNIILAFRAAIHCELLKEEEVKMLLQDRKREEAKLVKREAQKDDFINFVARDSIMLKLLQKRRKAINYTHKMAEIEYVFLQGGFITFLYNFSDLNDLFSGFGSFWRRSRIKTGWLLSC